MANDPKNPIDDDDWASAIDEWDANLALPDAPAQPAPKAEAAPAPPPVDPIPDPEVMAEAIPDLDSPPPLDDLPPPLDAAPGDAPADDPLMHLFDGEMELPEEAGQALGTLLGDSSGVELPAGVRAGEAAEEEPPSIDIDAPMDDFGAQESTRVAAAAEVSALLENLDELEPDRALLGAAIPEPDITVRTPAPTPEELEPPAAEPAESDDPFEYGGGDFGGGESTRVASSDEFAALLDDLPILDDPAETAAAGGAPEAAKPAPARLPSRPPMATIPSVPLPPKPAPRAPQPVDDDDDLEVEVVAPPAATDEDFYDDIAIEAGREESAPKPAPAERSAPRRVEELPSEPILVDPPLNAVADRASDPDRTPLPVADDDGLFEAAPEAPMPRAESRPIVAVRLEAQAELGRLAVADVAEAQPLDEAYLREQLAFFDTERLLQTEPERAARLACAAARVAERLGDLDGAEERLQAAVELDPASRTALRGLRRVWLKQGKSDRAVAMIDRETERGSPDERRGLLALKAELHLARGDRDLARDAFGDLLEAQPDELGASLGLVDVAAGEAREEELTPALERLGRALAGGDARLRAAVAVERGRLDEAAGRVRAAVERFREALGLDPQAAQAAWGLFRVAVGTPPGAPPQDGEAEGPAGGVDDADAHVRLSELLPRGPLRTAMERRFALLRLRAGDPAAARAALVPGAVANDPLTLRALVRLEQSEGRADEARVALQQLVDLEGDAGRRADLLFQLGTVEEARGSTGAAAAAYQRAAAEYPDDPRAARALERTALAGGDKISALDRHLAAAERDAARAPLEWTRAARLLDELGRRDEALDRLQAALGAQPGYPPAVETVVELETAAGRPERAAEVLLAAAEAADDRTTAAACRERAARLLQRAGRADAALAAIQPLLGEEDARAVRWLEQRLLEGGDPAQLAESLAAEAEITDEKPRACELWYRRGLLLTTVDPAAAAESLKRTLDLDPGHGPAHVALQALLSRQGGDGLLDLPPALRARLQAAGERPEAVALEVRLAASLAEDAADLAAARSVLEKALERTPGAHAAAELLDRLARRAGDDALVAAALERELERATQPEERLALYCALGERLERRGQPERAAERYRQALELRPGHPVAAFSLERAYKAARNFSALADLALQDLKAAEDVRKKVDAYERLAHIDGELRGDRESALLAYQSIVEVDPGHHVSMRVLERQYLRDGRHAELLALYAQLGLVANDPAFAEAVHLDRARLRGRVATAEASAEELQAAVAEDHRLALAKAPASRPALRHTLSRALASGDLAQVAELQARVAETAEGDPRTQAICATRAGEALWELGRADEAKVALERARERDAAHLPALLALRDLGLAREAFADAEVASAQEAETARDGEARTAAFLLAGALAEEKLGDLGRALSALKAALAVQPRSREGFARLRRVLTAIRDFQELAALYRARLEVETDGRRLVELHLELARLLRDHLNDRPEAVRELHAVLKQDAAHPEALAMLADLHYDDQQWAEAADALIRRARIEKDRATLKDIFFRLGLIYGEHLPDPKRAIASFVRVVKADPSDVVALEHLSNLYLKDWEWKGALEATQRLAQLEPNRERKIAHLHRVAKIFEEGFKDARHAHEALRTALELDPMYLPSIGELAKFFDRQSDVQSMRVHLDRTAARVRQLLDKDPRDAQAYHSLFRIFGWRRAPDRAAMAAGVLEWLGEADAEEKALYHKVSHRDGYPGSALADAALDEGLFDARVPAGFRHLFRLLDEPLGKLFRADVKRLGIGRQEKLPRSGHAARDLANRMAADLGIRDFDFYITAAHPTALMVELTEPLSIILGQKLVEGAHELELRFYLGRLMKMIQAHMALPMRLSPDDLGVLVGAIVRQFVPEFVPPGFDEKQVAAEGARMSKLIPKKMQAELFPFAMECASDKLDLKRVAPALVDTANRAGLLACGAIVPALKALERLEDPAQVRALLRFSMSEELAELRRQAGTSIG